MLTTSAKILDLVSHVGQSGATLGRQPLQPELKLHIVQMGDEGDWMVVGCMRADMVDPDPLKLLMLPRRQVGAAVKFNIGIHRSHTGMSVSFIWPKYMMSSVHVKVHLQRKRLTGQNTRWTTSTVDHEGMQRGLWTAWGGGELERGTRRHAAALRGQDVAQRGRWLGIRWLGAMDYRRPTDHSV